MSDFDYHQSANRVAIECAFGMLVRRWAILWTKLQCRFDRRAPLIGACIRLHNLCIEQGQEMWCGATNNGLEQVQPRDWAIPPRMDKNGAPIVSKHFPAFGYPGMDGSSIPDRCAE